MRAAHNSSDLTLPLHIDEPTRALEKLNGIEGNHSSGNRAFSGHCIDRAGRYSSRHCLGLTHHRVAFIL